MKVIIFIRDIIERLPNKTTYTQAIVSAFEEELTNISDKILVNCDGAYISIGGSDSFGRCNIHKLYDAFKKADIIIMPAISGPVEHSIITRKSKIFNEEYNVIIISPPQISRSSNMTDNALSNIFGCYVRSIVKQIIHKQKTNN